EVVRTVRAVRIVQRRSDRSVLDVLGDATERGFCGIDVARGIDGDSFAHRAVGRIRLVRWNECRHLAVFEAAYPDAAKPAGVNPFGRFRVGRVDYIVSIDGHAARAAEVVVLTNELTVLRHDLDAMVVAVGDDQPTL